MLLAYLGSAMVATGQPVHEVEEELAMVSRHLGFPEAQIAATPTGVMLSLSSGGPGCYESVKGALRLDQATEVRTIRHRLLTDDLTVAEATVALLQLRTRAALYPGWLTNAGAVGIAIGIALILQPGLANLVVVVFAAVVVLGLLRVSERYQLVSALLPTMAAFIVACLVFGAAEAQLLDGALRTLLPPLAVILPGALLVTGMSELAAGAMVAGTARLGYGAVRLLLFTVGVVAASWLLSVRPGDLANIRVDEFGWWAAPLGLAVISLSICLMESAPLRLMGWISAVLVLAFAAQALGQLFGGAPLGGFLGAVAASLGASLVEAVRPQLPRLVVFLPAFWLLVPGSLGLLGVTQLAIDPASAADTGFDIFALISSIAVGLLAGSAVARSVRRTAARVRTGRA